MKQNYKNEWRSGTQFFQAIAILFFRKKYPLPPEFVLKLPFPETWIIALPTSSSIKISCTFGWVPRWLSVNRHHHSGGPVTITFNSLSPI